MRRTGHAMAGVYYKAVITAVDVTAGSVSVNFPEYGNSDQVKVASLRPADGADASKKDSESRKRAAAEGSGTVKQALSEVEKEAKREKNKRKKVKRLESEQKRQQEVKAWMSFSKKKNKKGKKSIFASPDNPMGKVGIGTNNIGGRGMTDYKQRGKWQFEGTASGAEKEPPRP